MVVKARISPSKKKQIEDIISRGGDVPSEKDVKEEWKMISLRIPKSLLEEVDKERAKHIGITRNTWILQSITKNMRAKDE